MPTAAQRCRRPNVSGVYVATGNVVTSEEEKQVSQSDWVDDDRIRFECATTFESAFG